MEINACDRSLSAPRVARSRVSANPAGRRLALERAVARAAIQILSDHNGEIAVMTELDLPAHRSQAPASERESAPCVSIRAD